MSLSHNQQKKLARLCDELENLANQGRAQGKTETSFSRTATEIPTSLRVLMGVATLGGSEIALKIVKS